MIEFNNSILPINKLYSRIGSKTGKFVKTANLPDDENQDDMPLEQQLEIPPPPGMHPATWEASIRAHHAWREGRGFKERLKPTGEIDENGNPVQEDINRPFHLLTRKNQLLSSSAIENAHNLILENPTASVEELASGVHDFWIMQNQWMATSKDENDRIRFQMLSVPYEELPENEKQKDREFVIAAMNIIRKYSNGVNN